MAKFYSMPNFRKLTVKKDDAEKKNTEFDLLTNYDASNARWNKSLGSHKIYRSSKPDYLTEKDISAFFRLNFQTIIDLRSQDEYEKGDGDKLLDNFYPLYKVKLPQWRNYNPGEELTFKKLKSPKTAPRPTFYTPEDDEQTPLLDPTDPTSDLSPDPTDSLPERRHILINFFNLNFIWNVFNRISILHRFISLFILAYDFMLRTDKRYFVRYFAKHCLNSKGVKGLYVDIINLAQAPIYAALKLLTDPANVPVMLNCAHGKDRTGIMSALILCILGYSKDHIINDFAKSATELEPIKEKVIADTVGRMHVNMSFAGAEAETMEYVLDYIDENYGGVTSYLEKIGFTISDQNRLKENLIDGLVG